MSNVARPPEDFAGPQDEEEHSPPLGDLLSGLLSSTDIDSVEAVREVRESE